MSESESKASEGGIPAWVLSGAAVAVVMGALWYGTSEREAEPAPAPAPAPVAEKATPVETPKPVPVEPTAKPTVDREAALQTLTQAIELEKKGDLDNALALARHAAAGGAGSQALLLEGKILILQKQFDAARAPLQRILQADPKNADAHYNLGITWQQGKTRDYNKSRNAYLATLQASPRYAAARFNLAVLCLEYGVVDEAEHHVQTFAKDYPQDARGKTLQQMMEGARAKLAQEQAAAAKGAGK